MNRWKCEKIVCVSSTWWKQATLEIATLKVARAWSSKQCKKKAIMFGSIYFRKVKFRYRQKLRLLLDTVRSLLYCIAWCTKPSTVLFWSCTLGFTLNTNMSVRWDWEGNLFFWLDFWPRLMHSLLKLKKLKCLKMIKESFQPFENSFWYSM